MPGEDDNLQIINQLKSSLGDQFNPPAAALRDTLNPLAHLEKTNLEAQYLPYLSSDKIIIIENLPSTRYGQPIEEQFDITDSPIGTSEIQQNTKKALLTFLYDRQKIRGELGIDAIETQQQFFIVRKDGHWEVFQYDPPSEATNNKPKITHFNIKGDGMCGVTSAIKVAQLLDPANTALQNLTEFVSENFSNYQKKPEEGEATIQYHPANTAAFYHLKKLCLPPDHSNVLKYSFYDLDEEIKNHLTRHYGSELDALKDLLDNPSNYLKQFNAKQISTLLTNIFQIRTDSLSLVPSIFTYDTNERIVASIEIPSELDNNEFSKFLIRSKIFKELIKYQEIKDNALSAQAEKESFYDFLEGNPANISDLLIYKDSINSDHLNKKFLYHLASAYLDALEHFYQKKEVEKFGKIKTNLTSLTPIIKGLIPDFDLNLNFVTEPIPDTTGASPEEFIEPPQPPPSPSISSILPDLEELRRRSTTPLTQPPSPEVSPRAGASSAAEDPTHQSPPPSLPHDRLEEASDHKEPFAPQSSTTPAPHASPRKTIAYGKERLKYKKFEDIETENLADYFKYILRKDDQYQITTSDLDNYMPDCLKPIPATYKGFGFSFEVTNDSLKIDGVSNESFFKSKEAEFLNKEIIEINGKKIQDHFQSAKDQNIDPKYYFAHLIRRNQDLKIKFKDNNGIENEIDFANNQKKHFSVDSSTSALKISEEKDPQKIAKTENPAYVLDFRNILFAHIDLKFEELDQYLANDPNSTDPSQQRKIKFPSNIPNAINPSMGTYLAVDQWKDFEESSLARNNNSTRTQHNEDTKQYLSKKYNELKTKYPTQVPIGTVGNGHYQPNELHIFSANNTNFNNDEYSKIDGGGQADAMGLRTNQNFGIITTPHNLKKGCPELDFDIFCQSIITKDKIIGSSNTSSIAARTSVSPEGVGRP